MLRENLPKVRSRRSQLCSSPFAFSLVVSVLIVDLDALFLHTKHFVGSFYMFANAAG